jgi:protein-tyrosine phosphatase
VIAPHCHVLPGVDDGPETLDDSIELCRAAVAAGTRTIVATPHVSWDWPGVTSNVIAEGVERVNDALRAEGIDLEVRAGAEIAMTRAGELSDDELAALRLGGGPYLLIECPYSPASAGFDGLLHAIAERGHEIVLAHPERCPAFQRDPARLERLVDGGVLVQITAGSMAGGFGSTVRRFTAALLRDGLVHAVASDAHDAVKRPPGLNFGFTAIEHRELPGIGAHQAWLTEAAPRAILDGAPLPERPPLPRPGGLLRRLGLRA